MPPPPARTWRATRSALGCSRSRFGPNDPSASAAASVWQSPQPASSKTCAPCGSASPAVALFSSLPPHPARARASASAAISVSGARQIFVPGTCSEYSRLEREGIPDLDAVEPQRAPDDGSLAAELAEGVEVVEGRDAARRHDRHADAEQLLEQRHIRAGEG